MNELARSIAELSWGQSLAGYGQRGWTGTLAVVADDRRFSISIDRGAVIDASSPLATDAAVRVALIAQLISSTKVSEILRHLAGSPARDELAVIADVGRLSHEQTEQLRRRVIARRAARTFSLDGKPLRVDEGPAITTSAPPSPALDLREVIFLGAHENLSAERLSAELARFGSWFRLKPSELAGITRFGFDGRARPIIDRLCDGASLAELESCTPGMDVRLVWSILYALTAWDACDVADAGPAAREPEIVDLVAPRPRPRPRTRTLDPEVGQLAPRPRLAQAPPKLATVPPPRAISDLVGVTIGDRYVVEQKLGIGSTGVVYRAHHTKLTRLFALKILHRGLLADDKAVRRFEREAQLAGALSHPNVVSVVDVGTHDGVPYLAMEHAEGASLASLLQEGPMQPARVIALLRQLCLGLAHAHERNVIHRDLKPENVIVESTGTAETPRIADFALAILREGGETERLTAAGVVLGTPAYMAPEHATGGTLDHRVDLYALGVIAYQMLTGVLPFAGSNVEIAIASFRDEPPEMSKRVPGLAVDPLLEALTRLLLAKTPDARPRDANEVRRILDLIETDRPAAAALLGVSAAASEPAPAPAPVESAPASVPSAPAPVPSVPASFAITHAAAPVEPKHPATIAMWKLSRDPDPAPAPATVAAPAPVAPADASSPHAPVAAFPPAQPPPARAHASSPHAPGVAFAPAPPPVASSPVLAPAVLPALRSSRARYDGSGTVSSALPTEVMAPIRTRPTWPIVAIVAAAVFVLVLVLALR